MEPNERNRVMDRLLRDIDSGDDACFSSKSNAAETIRECDRLSRAWDKLDHWLTHEHCGPLASFRGREEVREKMKSLLNPTPDPLEVLERKMYWSTIKSWVQNGRVWVDREDVLAEILRLRGKK